MPTRPSVSIAMATFNGAAHLAEQLASLLAQDERPGEIVITDDGSTDATEAVVKSFAATAPFPVHWHRNGSRLGYRANFMRAASLCIGDLIAFCDQDDAWYPEKLRVAVDAFADPDVLLFHHEARVVRDGRVVASAVRKVHEAAPRTPMLRSAPWQYPLGFTVVFRASLREHDRLWTASTDIKGFDAQATHDQWFYFLASSLGTVAFHSEPLADYRQHGRNVYGIGQTRHNRLERLRFLFENRIPMYRRLSAAAAERSESCAGIRTGDHEALLGSRVAAEAWKVLALAYRLRADLYDRALFARFRAMVRLLLLRSYGSAGFWSFGRRALMKDCVLGLLLGPFVARFGTPATGEDWMCIAGDGRAVALAHAHLRRPAAA